MYMNTVLCVLSILRASAPFISAAIMVAFICIVKLIFPAQMLRDLHLLNCDPFGANR